MKDNRAVIIEETAVPIGKYTITEIAPDGFNQLAGAIVISVEEGEFDGDVVVTATINGETDNAHAKLTRDTSAEGKPWTLTIVNDAGVELPQTGGSGTNQFYLHGIMLTGIAGAGLVMRKRKRA